MTYLTFPSVGEIVIWTGCQTYTIEKVHIGVTSGTVCSLALTCLTVDITVDAGTLRS